MNVYIHSWWWWFYKKKCFRILLWLYTLIYIHNICVSWTDSWIPYIYIILLPYTFIHSFIHTTVRSGLSECYYYLHIQIHTYIDEYSSPPNPHKYRRSHCSKTRNLCMCVCVLFYMIDDVIIMSSLLTKVSMQSDVTKDYAYLLLHYIFILHYLFISSWTYLITRKYYITLSPFPLLCCCFFYLILFINSDLFHKQILLVNDVVVYKYIIIWTKYGKSPSFTLQGCYITPK